MAMLDTDRLFRFSFFCFLFFCFGPSEGKDHEFRGTRGTNIIDRLLASYEKRGRKENAEGDSKWATEHCHVYTRLQIFRETTASPIVKQ